MGGEVRCGRVIHQERLVIQSALVEPGGVLEAPGELGDGQRVEAQIEEQLILRQEAGSVLMEDGKLRDGENLRRRQR